MHTIYLPCTQPSFVVGDLRDELGLCEARSLTPACVGLLACSADVDLYVKGSACSETGWTYVDDIFTSASNDLSMTAGVTYYILIDDENTSPSEGTVMITCPEAVADPCDRVVNLQCGVAANFDLPAGSGDWNPATGPYGTPGNEVLFSYTPELSGTYTTSTTNAGGCEFLSLSLSPPPTPPCRQNTS